jgi:hypothetical protein
VILLVPCVGEMQPEDRRLTRLAEFLGIAWSPLELVGNDGQWEASLKKEISEEDACLVVNPAVLRDFVGENAAAELASILVSNFSRLLVYAPKPKSFDSQLIQALSGGEFEGVRGIGVGSQPYVVSPNSSDICGDFSRITFGAARASTDSVFTTPAKEASFRILISIGSQPFMAALKREEGEILCLGCQDIADLDSEVGETPLKDYFSTFLPPAMALRYFFRDECWRPVGRSASVIVDDPLLRQSYGFLNFGTLLELTKRHDFHTTIAFIPHNFRRSSPKIAKMFRENKDRLAICFHGNDHTGAEFASTDVVLLNTMLEIAEHRMLTHQEITGLECDRVMVFPQGNFSVEAMAVLKARNFSCAINTVPHPTQQPIRLKLSEIAVPAVLRYAGFPLFLRKDSAHTQPEDIAFATFFGRPVVIVEHHDIFENPEPLIEAAGRINGVSPGIRWSSPEKAGAGAILRRRIAGGYHVRAYAGTVRVSNDSNVTQKFLVEWAPGDQVNHVSKDGQPCSHFETDAYGTRISVELAAGGSAMLAISYRNGRSTVKGIGLRQNAKAYVRRRLSEVRDNYLSKNAYLLAAAKTVKKHLIA